VRPLRAALITGGAGFLGSWIVETVENEGLRTTVIDDLSTGSTANLNVSELIVADVREANFEEILDTRAIDVVFHLATPAYVPPSLRWPVHDLERNVVGTLALLEGVRKSKHPPLVVYASSAAVYGEGETMPMAENHLIRPVSPYGVSKLAAEHYVRLYSELYGIPTLSARLFSLYGPRQRKQVVYDLMSRAFNGERPLTVLGSAHVSRDFVFVKDAARAILALARRAPARGEAYNIASGKPTSLGKLIAMLIQEIGLQIPVRFTGDVRTGDPLHWEGDPRKAQALGAVCATPLIEGIRATAQWYLETHRPSASASASALSSHAKSNTVTASSP
jgi:UDP-glucose 4-epimerase